MNEKGMMHLGIDYGSSTIKAVSVDENNDLQTVPLGRFQFIPNLCCLDDSLNIEQALPGIEQAYEQQFLTHSKSFAQGLRDQAVAPDEIVSALGQTVSAIEVHGWPWAAAKQAIIAHGQPFQNVVVSIPDAWCNRELALPAAMKRISLTPLAYVPESLAVAVSLKSDRIHTINCLSIGGGSLNLSQVKCQNNQLTVEKTFNFATLGEKHLRLAFEEHLVNEIVKKTRQMVLENRDETLRLKAWIHSFFQSLQTGQSINQPLQIFGQTIVADRMDIDLLLDGAGKFLSRLDKTLTEMETKFDFGQPTFVWGGGAFIFDSVLLRTERTWNVNHPGLNCVARGCAIISRDVSKGIRQVLDETNMIIRATDGSKTYSTDLNDDIVPILSPLHHPDGSQASQAELEWINGPAPETVPINNRILRIGRDERSELVIDRQDFPTVSLAHAMIVQSDDGYLVRDLGSSNGTYVNNEKIDEKKLDSGDRIQLGRSGPEFCFRGP